MHPDEAGGAICRCGHPRDAHEHYRAGTECVLCADCLRFRPSAGLLRQFAASVARRARFWS